MTEIQQWIKDHTQTQRAYLLAENSARPKEPSRIDTVHFVKVIYRDEASTLCYHVEYSDGSFEDVPVTLEGQKIIDQNQVNYYCFDCRKNTQLNSYYDSYIVKDELWKEFGAEKNYLCITCLQCRMERELVPEDFTDSALNTSNRFIKNLKAKTK